MDPSSVSGRLRSLYPQHTVCKSYPSLSDDVPPAQEYAVSNYVVKIIPCLVLRSGLSPILPQQNDHWKNTDVISVADCQDMFGKQP